MKNLSQTLLVAMTVSSFCLHTAWAEVPNYYRILADDYEFPNSEILPGKPRATSWKPTADDQKNGFAAALMNMEETPSPHWIWQETNPSRDIRFISLKGECRAQAMAIRTLTDLKGLSISGSPLVSQNKTTIPADNWDLRIVKHLKHNLESGPMQDSNLLKRAVPMDCPKDLTVTCWLTFHTPPKTQPGLYTGTVTVTTANGNQTRLPVTLRVLDKTYQPPAGEWGMWMPGHFHGKSKGYCRNYAAPWWRADRIVDFFKFWKTRGFTSPTYSGIYPEIRMIDGKITMDFTEVDKVMKAPQKAGLKNHKILADTLLFEYWAHIAAMTIQSRFQGKIPPKGDLGVTKADGVTCLQSGVFYSPLAGKIYCDIMTQVMQHAREQGWPQVIFYPEEEIGNQPFKVAGYDFFMPLLKKTVGPEHCMTIDNNLGELNERLDRGDRDDMHYRNYNFWDQKALDDAQKDKAQVYSFNRGFLRSAWGHYMQRIGASGNHQWADHWDGGAYGRWFNCVPTGNGKVLTSVNYERAAMGLRDLALLRELQKQGKPFQRTLKKINDLVRLDLTRKDANHYYANIKDSELEARRFWTLLELAKAGRLAIPTLPPKPLALEVVSTQSLSETKVFAAAKHQARLESKESGHMLLDGLALETGYHHPQALVTTFYHTKNREAQLRSQAASEEDWKRYRPSPWKVAITHDAKGLYLHFQADKPQFSQLRRKRLNDDPALWEDDCFDIFLQPPQAQAPWQIIFNTANQVLLLKNESTVIPNNGIKVVTIPNQNGPGYQQEIFIPYAALDIPQQPASGEIWKINLGRESQALNQYVTWRQVLRNFGVGDGVLSFADNSEEIITLAMGNGVLGMNQTNGQLRQPKCRIKLQNPWGKIFQTTSDSKGCFSLKFPVTRQDAGNWNITITSPSGQLIRKRSWNVNNARETLAIRNISPVAISGDRIYVDLDMNLGNAEQTCLLKIQLLDQNGKSYQLPDASVHTAQTLRLFINTQGLPEGDYAVKVQIESPETDALSKARCKILPPAR